MNVDGYFTENIGVHRRISAANIFSECEEGIGLSLNVWHRVYHFSKFRTALEKSQVGNRMPLVRKRVCPYNKPYCGSDNSDMNEHPITGGYSHA